MAVDEKYNGITAVPRSAETAVVSLDAMHCQKAMAKAIRDAGADYPLQPQDRYHIKP